MADAPESARAGPSGDNQVEPTIHATAIASANRCALIRGPSGSGKSDLALRCLAAGGNDLVPARARLVADDRVVLEARDGALWARAPAGLAGFIEVRGLGIFRVVFQGSAKVHLVVDLVAAGDAVERLPETTDTVSMAGVLIAHIRLHPFEASAPIKLLLALARGAASS